MTEKELLALPLKERIKYLCDFFARTSETIPQMRARLAREAPRA